MVAIALWSMIATRAVIGLAAFALCLMLIRRLRREKLTRELLGENGMQAAILDGELHSLYSEGKWLTVTWITAWLRLGYVADLWWKGQPIPYAWDAGDAVGASVVLAFTTHSAWVVWRKRQERKLLYSLAREERRKMGVTR